MSEQRNKASLGFETVQYRKFPIGEGPDLVTQISVAANAGFDWISISRHLLVQRAAAGGSLQEVADACREYSLPCGVLQALVVTGDPDELQRSVDAAAAEVAVLQPDTVSCNFFVAPTDPVLDQFSKAVGVLLAVKSDLRFGIEFGPLWPVESISDARAIVARSEPHPVGLIVDTWHFFHGSSSWEDLDRLPLDDIVLVQFNDHGDLGTTDLTIAKDHRRLPGQGVFPLARFATTMKEKGFRGLVGIEVIAEELRRLSVEAFATQVHESAAPYWQ